MVEAAHKLLSEADAVISYNGDGFDFPHLNREFLAAGLTPPAPYASIDLLKTVRKQFRHASNKLDWIAQQLGVGKKTPHSGFQLWLDCLRGDPKAWKLMEKYNRQDVKVTLGVYKKILPWITTHPSVPMFEGRREGCPNCGGFKATRQGVAYTPATAYQRWKCSNPKCGRWYRTSQKADTAEARGL
jgi:RNase_H superfamily